MLRAAIVLCLGFAFAGCITVERDEPLKGEDVIVAVDVSCKVTLSASAGFEFRGAQKCSEAKDSLATGGGAFVSDYTTTLTVRTISGATYLVPLEGPQSFTVGQKWPQ